MGERFPVAQREWCTVDSLLYVLYCGAQWYLFHYLQRIQHHQTIQNHQDVTVSECLSSFFKMYVFCLQGRVAQRIVSQRSACALFSAPSRSWFLISVKCSVFFIQSPGLLVVIFSFLIVSPLFYIKWILILLDLGALSPFQRILLQLDKQATRLYIISNAVSILGSHVQGKKQQLINNHVLACSTTSF